MAEIAQGGHVWSLPTAAQLEHEAKVQADLKKAEELEIKQNRWFKISLTLAFAGLFIIIISGLFLGAVTLLGDPWLVPAVIFAITGPIFGMVGLFMSVHWAFKE